MSKIMDCLVNFADATVEGWTAEELCSRSDSVQGRCEEMPLRLSASIQMGSNLLVSSAIAVGMVRMRGVPWEGA